MTILDDRIDDDLVVLEMAQKEGGFIISNDRFSQEMYAGFGDVRERLIEYNWQKDEHYKRSVCATVAGRCKLNLKIHFHKTLAEFERKIFCF